MLKNPLVTPEQRNPEQDEPQAVAISAGGAARQNTWRNIGLIVGREYKQRVAQRSFIISTIIILVLIILGACAPTIIGYFASKSSSQAKITIVNNAGSIAGLGGNDLNSRIGTYLNGTASTSGSSSQHFVINSGNADQQSNLRNQVKSGKLDVLLVVDRNANQDLQFTYYTNSSVSNDTNLTQVQGMAAQLETFDKAARLGLSPSQTSSLFAPPTFNVQSLTQDTRTVGDRVASYFIAYAGIILIFMSVFMYGMGVAQGVAEEKGSRIMEILVNAATPFQLMVGKILGLGAAGLTQMAAFVVVGLVALELQNPLKGLLYGDPNATGGITINLTGVSATLLILLLVYFILGFLLYASLFAAMGALVKRQDEIQNAVQPITWLFMVGYIVSFIGLATPDATWVKIVSYIPFWTPTTMLMRIGVGNVQPWEIALTIVLMIVAIFVCAIISARIYRFGILMYGQRPGLGQLARLVRMK